MVARRSKPTAPFHVAPDSALIGVHSHCHTVIFRIVFLKGLDRDQNHQHLAYISSVRKLNLGEQS